jgi:hypothetical protein
MDTTALDTNHDLPQGAAFLPINCVTARRTTGASNRPLLALIDAKLLPELSPYNWRTSESSDQNTTGHVFRIIVDDRLVIAGSKKQTSMREGLGARVRGVHMNLDDRVLYRNGDRLDCRMCNVIPWAEHTVQGVDPTLKVSPGSSFQHLDSYGWASRERNEKAGELAARFPLGPKPKLTQQQVLQLLTMIRDDKFCQGQSYGWIREWVIQGNFGTDLTIPSIRAILRGEQQRIQDFDYAPLLKHLPVRATKRAERLEALKRPAK